MYMLYIVILSVNTFILFERKTVRIRICMLRGENYDMIWLCDEFQYAAGQEVWDRYLYWHLKLEKQYLTTVPY